MDYTIPLAAPGLAILIMYIIIGFVRVGTKNLSRRLGFYSMLFFGIVVVHVTFGGINIPPRPMPWINDQLPVQLIPFFFILDIFHKAQETGRTLFNLGSFTMAARNLLLLAPLGIYLPWLFRIRSVGKVALIAGLVSLSIETGQLITTVTGLTRPRMFNIDDLILNTLGAVLAYLLFTFLARARSSGGSKQ